MKKLITLLLVLTFCSSFANCEEPSKFGSLQVISKTSPFKVYVDNELKGNTPLKIDKIQVGSHFVSVTSASEGTKEAVVFEDLVVIREGELQTIALPLTLSVSQSNVPVREKIEAVETNKKLKEYYDKNYGGYYLKLNYLSSYYSSDDSWDWSSYSGTAVGAGIGYEFAMSPNISIIMEIDNGTFSDHEKQWSLTPMILSLRSEAPAPSAALSKSYYGIGVAYESTDMTLDSENQSARSFFLSYGMEFPSGEKDAFFFDTYIFMGGHLGLCFGGGFKWGK